jgi:mono/diheme cytochrome c family protein
MRAFTPLATIGVLALSASGGYAAWQFVGSWDLLRTTPYGGALVGKVVLAAAMLTFGAWHSWIARVPSSRLGSLGAWQPESDPLASGPPNARSLEPLVARTLRVETGLGVAVLLVAAILTVLPTAYTPPPGMQATQASDDLTLTLRVSPGRVGMNDYVLRVEDATGPVAVVRSARLRFTAASGRVPSSELQLTARGDGTYTARSADLGVADAWLLQTIIRREGEFDTFANFNLALDQREAATRWLPWTSASLIGLALVLAVAVWVLWPDGVWRRVGRPAALSGAAAVLALSVYWLAQPAPVDANSLLNPIPASPASTDAGHALYEANCLACHGPEGAGDGLVGLTLNPRPADLRAHAVPGVHSDGQLYRWITGGFPGSVMPAFAETLTDEERWHLVNYLRTLAP